MTQERIDRHRLVRTVLLPILALALVASCGDDGTNGQAADVAEATEVARDVTRIPNGTYERVVTFADAEALGVDPALARDILGPDGELPVALEIYGERWRHLVTNDVGIEEVGDLGRSSYDDDGHWVTVSTSDGCPGCTAVLAWSLDGDELDVRFVTEAGDEPPPDALRALLVVQGTYRLRVAAEEPSTALAMRIGNILDDTPEQIVAYLAEIDRITGGAVGWEVEHDYAGMNPVWHDAEADLVRDVSAGTIDAGIVGARALPGLEALVAPLLIDSYELQDEVFAAGIATDALEQVDVPGLVAVAVLPGPMRKVLGVEQAFTTPAHFAGKRLAGDANPVAEATAQALGATPLPGSIGQPIDEFDALHAHVAAISGNGYDRSAAAVTANLNLWPRPLVLVMHQTFHDSLPEDIRRALSEAGTAAAPAASQETQRVERLVTHALCSSEIETRQATTEELAAIDAAVAPVREELRSDPATAALLDEIVALRKELAAPPSTISCP